MNLKKDTKNDTLKEKTTTTHSDTIFPVTVYGFDQSAYTKLFLHWHDDIEVICMCSGKGVFQTTEGLVEVSEGQAMFINSGELHTGHPTDSTRTPTFIS